MSQHTDVRTRLAAGLQIRALSWRNWFAHGA